MPSDPSGIAQSERPADDLFGLLAASPVSTLAIVGLAKNAGKTTVVNAILANADRPYGLTSLGLDGEQTD